MRILLDLCVVVSSFTQSEQDLALRGSQLQYVIFNNHESDLTEIASGVPQGSILGPLLFSTIINDLKKSSKKLRFLMYADDTTIYFNLEDFD